MKLWLDGQTPPITDDWKWCRTSQEAVPLIQSKQITDATLFLNYGDDSAMSSLRVVRLIYDLAKTNSIPRIKWTLLGGVDRSEVRKAFLVLAEIDKLWTAAKRKAAK